MQNLRLNFRIDRETRERLDRLAKELQADRSSLIRVLIAHAQPQELKIHLARLDASSVELLPKVQA